MAKDTDLKNDEVQDDKASVGADNRDDGGTDLQEDKPVKMSVREAIRAAVKESSGEEDEGKPEKKEEKEVREVKSKDKGSDTDESKVSVSDKAPKDLSSVPKDTREKGTEDNKASKVKDSPSAEKLKPPPGFTKEAKAEWDTWSPGLQKSILKREEEYAKGIATYSSRAKAYDELDKVIAPYREAIQNFGTTEAETIGNLFQWMMALSDRDTSKKANAFKVLANSFGIDVSQLAPRTGLSSRVDPEDDDTDRQQQVIDPNQPPSWFVNYAQQNANEVNNLKSFLANQGQVQARTFVLDWAKDKPYFQHVNELMYKLIDSGTVPLKADGSVDLDQAYEAACKLHPGVAENIALEKEKEAASAAEEKKAKEAKARAQQLARARTAGVGLRPNAPAGTPSAPVGKPNGKVQSVRDSIASAIQEVRDR